MTAHRAALPVTTEVSGVSRVGFLAASPPQGLRPPGHLLPSQPQPVGASYPPPAQPSAPMAPPIRMMKLANTVLG